MIGLYATLHNYKRIKKDKNTKLYFSYTDIKKYLKNCLVIKNKNKNNFNNNNNLK